MPGFDPKQVQELKEAFQLIDQNKDGVIDKNDLNDTFMALGLTAKPKEVDAMINDAPGKLNFATFCSMFSDKFHGTDPEDMILNAFKLFDDQGTGKITETRFIKDITSMADKFKPDEVDDMLDGAPIGKDGLLDYVEFCGIIKRGPKEEE